jgi:putative heme iron utilization protein
MAQHAYPSDVQDLPQVPEPTYAERARTLVYLGRIGTLSTLSRRHPGHPFGSVMPYAPDAQGHPLLLISTMAMHTQNLLTDPRASLLVTQAGWTGDPLAAGRVTLMGEARRVSGADTATAREAYLARHPNAAYWVDFDDFGFYRLEIAEIYFVGGFAAMDWIPPDDYLMARPDPLADAAPGIIEHMNQDHADALLTFARVLAGVEADEALMVSVDRLGFKLRMRSGSRISGSRIAFPREVVTSEQCRAVLIEMLRDARQRASR